MSVKLNKNATRKINFEHVFAKWLPFCLGLNVLNPKCRFTKGPRQRTLTCNSQLSTSLYMTKHIRCTALVTAFIIYHDILKRTNQENHCIVSQIRPFIRSLDDFCILTWTNNWNPPPKTVEFPEMRDPSAFMWRTWHLLPTYSNPEISAWKDGNSVVRRQFCSITFPGDLRFRSTRSTTRERRLLHLGVLAHRCWRLS